MKHLKTSIVTALLLALAAVPSQAQECITGARPLNARAEDETALTGNITLRCRGPRARGADDELTLGTSVVTKLEIAVTLNTDIANGRDSDDMIETGSSVGYLADNIILSALTLNANQEVTALSTSVVGNLSGGAVSDDLRTVTWKVEDQDDPADGIADELAAFQLGLDAQGDADPGNNLGFELRILGLRADASGVGHGGEITAEVMVNGTVVNGSPLSLSSVRNGLAVSVKEAKGDECEDVDTTATITLQEGFNKNAFWASDNFLITFRNIPEGVTVMVPTTVPLAEDDPATNADENAESLILELVEGSPRDGVGKPEGGKAMVELSAAGTGEIRYTIGSVTVDGSTRSTITPAGDFQEKADLPVYFSWSGGDVVMNADALVYVSFSPVGGSAIPRFVGDSEPDAILTVADCVHELTFPFVSSASGYDTGIVVSNTKDASGSCTASYSGSEDTVDSPVIEGNEHWIFLVSSHMADYSGRLMVTCDFGGIDGYAQINDAMGNSQGYLPRM